jgi:hypothetical protein
MPAASFVQTSFLGGEWSPFYQGRMDSPRYAAAMNRCLNNLPLEEGAAARRPGTRFAATTRNGNPGVLLSFGFSQAQPYNVELTDGHLRLFAGPDLVKEGTVGVVGITDTDPAVVSVDASVDWADGDQVEFEFESASSTSAAAILRYRQFVVNMLSDTTFTLADPITGDVVNGADVGWDPEATTAQVSRIVDIETPYDDEAWRQVRTVQDQRALLLLHPTIQPYVLEAISTPSDAAFAEFNFAPAFFIDGPYQDPIKGVSLNPSAITGEITLVAEYQIWDAEVVYTLDEYVTHSGTVYRSLAGYNLGNTPSATSQFWQVVDARFKDTDIGRLIRLFSQPEAWDADTVYAVGDKVAYGGAYYVAIEPPANPDDPPGPNEDQQPDVALEYWAIDVNGAIWTWGEITAIVESNAIDVQLLGGDLLYDEDIFVWRLGLYSDTTGYPTCGCYHEGRFWLAGAQPNRIDASKSNDTFNMAPSDLDGTVADDNAIPTVMNAHTINTVLWARASDMGVLVGTQDAEWLIQASSLQDPLTPTSRQAFPISTFGSEPVEPVEAGLATVFVQRYGRKVTEMLPASSGNARLAGNNLSLEAKHLTVGNVEELAYQEELFPCLWARTGEGKLIGCTFRRSLGGDPKVTNVTAWHRHELGSERKVVSIAAGASPGGDTDSLFMVTYDPEDETPVYWVEILTNLFEQDDTLLQSWFLDGAVTPSGATATEDGVTFYGLWHLNGRSVTVFAAGIDLGEWTIEDGQIFVPWNPALGFTLAYFEQVSESGEDFGGLGVFVDSVVTVEPPEDINQTILSFIPSTPLGLPSNRYIDWDEDRFMAVTSGGIFLFDTVLGVQLAFGQIGDLFPDILGSAYSNGVIARDGYFYVSLGGGNCYPIGRVDYRNNALEAAGMFGIQSGVSNAWPYGMPGNGGTVGAFRAQGWTFLAISGHAADQFTALISVDDDGGMSYVTEPLPHILARLTFLTPRERGMIYAVETADAINTTSSIGIHIYTVTDERAADPWSNLAPYNNLTNYVVGQKVGVTYTNQARQVGFECISPVTGSAPPGGSWAALDNPYVTWEERGRINASDVDPQWALFNVSNPTAVILDDTDGNIIMSLTSPTPGALTPWRIIKIRPEDLSIVWNIVPPTGFDFTLGSRVRRGYLGSFEGGIGIPKSVMRMHTLTGQVDTGEVVVSNVNRDSPQLSDDTTGNLIIFCDYTGPGPEPIFNTPTSFASEWAQLYPGSYLIGPTTIEERLIVPVVIGYTYTTQGQILRPIAPDRTGAANGPGFAKTRRDHMFGTLLHNCVTQVLKFGTQFDRLFPALFKTPDGRTAYTKLEMFSGIYTTTIQSDYDYDAMLCWEISRPFPATILTIGAFTQTQDR